MNKVEKKFERLCNALAFISVYFLVSSFAAPIFASTKNGFILLFGSLFVLAIMSAGYWLQAFVCRISRFKRRQDDGIYESNVRYFDLGRASISLIISAGVGFSILPLFKELYRQIAMNTLGMVYDRFSIMPWIFSASISIVMMIGAVVWFYPYQRFAKLRYPLVCLPILIIAFFFGSQMGGMAVAVNALSLLGYVLCIFAIMNQGTITRRYGSSDLVSFMNGRSRIYNIAMTSALLPVFLIAAGLLYVLIGGLTVLGRMGLLLFFMATNTKTEEYTFTASEVSGFMFGIKPAERAAYSTSFTLFLLLGTVALFLILMRRSQWVINFFRSVKRWLEALIEFICSISYLEILKKRYDDDDEDEVLSFKDEEKLHQKAVINPYVKKAEATKSYRDFLLKLNSFRQDDEKLHFAYTTLVTQLYRAGRFIKRSDTPRQIAKKLKSDPNYKGIEGITEAFEIVAYADQDLTTARADQALITLCSLLRHHLS